MNLYADIILDYWRNPQNFGELENPDLEAYELNPLCGDEIKIQLKTHNLGLITKISRAKFLGNGCAISQASASLLTEFIKGKELIKLVNLTEKDIIELLGIEIGPARFKCATLSLAALKKALKNGRQEKIKSSNISPAGRVRLGRAS